MADVKNVFPRQPVTDTPPLDYELGLDLGLDVPDLDRIEAMFDDGVPAGPFPPAVRLVLAIAAVLVVISLAMVLP